MPPLIISILREHCENDEIGCTISHPACFQHCLSSLVILVADDIGMYLCQQRYICVLIPPAFIMPVQFMPSCSSSSIFMFWFRVRLMVLSAAHLRLCGEMC